MTDSRGVGTVFLVVNVMIIIRDIDGIICVFVFVIFALIVIIIIIVIDAQSWENDYLPHPHRRFIWHLCAQILVSSSSSYLYFSAFSALQLHKHVCRFSSLFQYALPCAPTRAFSSNPRAYLHMRATFPVKKRACFPVHERASFPVHPFASFPVKISFVLRVLEMSV